MSAATSVAAGLQAAWLLARGRPEGLARLGAEPDDEARMAARSFWAFVLCLPAFIALHVADWVTGGLPPQPARGFALALAGFAIDWAGFAVLSHTLAGATGRGLRWPRYIAAWNWCNVAQYLMLTVAVLPTLLGLPEIVAETAWLVAIGWALWLEWYATRLALAVGPLQAAGITLLDVTLGTLISALTGAS